MINTKQLQPAALGHETYNNLISKFRFFFEDILGLKEEKNGNEESIFSGFLVLYKEFKENQQYDKVDQIRSFFKANNMVIKDLKHRIDWAWEE